MRLSLGALSLRKNMDVVASFVGRCKPTICLCPKEALIEYLMVWNNLIALHSRSLRDLAPFLLADSTWPSLQLTALLTGFGTQTDAVVTFYSSKIHHSANSIRGRSSL